MLRRLPLLLTVLLSAVLCVTAAAPASAHTRLVSSVPAQGEPVAAPREVRLVFSDPVQPALSAVSVTGADGREHAAGQPVGTGNGTSVTQALRSPLPPGTYRVAYRVLAGDGHPVTGSFELTATAPAPTTGPAAADTAAPVATDPPAAAAEPSLRPAATAKGEAGGAPVLLLVLGGLVVAGGVGLVARRLGSEPPSA